MNALTMLCALLAKRFTLVPFPTPIATDCRDDEVQGLDMNSLRQILDDQGIHFTRPWG